MHTLLADSEQLFRAMFDRSPIATALLTEDQRIARVNAACAQLLGHDADELMGRAAAELARPDPVPRRRGGDTTSGPHDQYEIHFTRPDGQQVWGRVNSTLLTAETRSGPSLVLTQIEDITMLRTMQTRFAHAATHDWLTGLPNRALVFDRLAAALTGSSPGAASVAVLFCDLDHFKKINDTMGHAAGDQLLIEVGRRLELTARERDTVGRFGGDEFVLIGYPVLTPAEAISLAARVMQTVQQPFQLGGRSMAPSISIGIALSAADDTADAVLATADRALYAAKAAGRGRWRLAASG